MSIVCGRQQCIVTGSHGLWPLTLANMHTWRQGHMVCGHCQCPSETIESKTTWHVTWLTGTKGDRTTWYVTTDSPEATIETEPHGMWPQTALKQLLRQNHMVCVHRQHPLGTQCNRSTQYVVTVSARPDHKGIWHTVCGHNK